MYGFSKANRANISKKELKTYKKDAKVNFSRTDEQIEDYLRIKTLIEVL